MRKMRFLFYTLLLTIKCYSQQTIYAKEIYVNFDKVVHLVFQTPIEYVSSGSSNIETTIVPNAANVVRIVALEEDFIGSTNVTIIDNNGTIYTFTIQYMSGDIQTVFLPDKLELPEDYKIIINKDNSAHLVFPNDIIYYYLGTSDCSAEQLKTSKNIIRVNMATDKLIARTNIFCYSSDGKEYNINIDDSISNSYIYTLGKDKANMTINDNKLEKYSQNAINLNRGITNQGMKKEKYEFSLNNILIKDEQLFFVFEIINKSNINLDIDFVKAFFVDERITKNAVQQETPIDYIHSLGFSNTIEARNSNKFVLVFNKFTIPDKKVFRIEIYEKGGGRHINFDIKNKVIMKARPADISPK